MKKVGIVTTVGYDNYGILLQNYAVTKLIEDMGYQAVTLNNDLEEQEEESDKQVKSLNKLRLYYVRRYFKVKLFQALGCKNTADFLPQNLIRILGKKRTFYRCRELRYRKFKKFRSDYIPYETLPIENSGFLESDYTAFVCGSDVIWYPKLHYNKINDFLGFTPRYKRIALAPSFGVSEIPEERKESYKKWLDGIKYLSVREKAGAAIIKDLIQREAEILPDPTLSIKAEHWRSIAKKPDVIPHKSYVLCYFLGNVTHEYLKWIKECARVDKKEIVWVYDVNYLQYYATDPSEFLWLLDNADAVFTDSFHGIVFSMLLHTPFVAFRRIEEGLSIFSRIESLLHCMNMEEREYGKIGVNQFDKLKFDLIDDKIKQLRKKECDFLNKAFQEIEVNEHND